MQMIESNPLQLYCSGLLFAPTESIIRKRFTKDIPTWISSVRDPVQYWSPEIQTLEGHPLGIRSITFSSDGELLASACWQQILVWKAKTGALQYRLEARKGIFQTLDFSLNNLLASGTNDGELSIWDATTGTLQHLIQLDSVVCTVRFSPDGLLVSAGFDDGKVIICDAVTGAIKHSSPHSACVHDVAFSPDGKSLVSCFGDGTMGLWDTQTGKLIHSVHGHPGHVLSAAFSPDGSLIVSGWSDNTVRIWDCQTGSLIHILQGHSDKVLDVVFFPTGCLVASASRDETVKIWDAERGTLTYSLEGHSGAIKKLAVSPCGEKLLSASSDGTAKLWDTRTGRLQATLQGHTASVHAVGFSPTGRLMATGSDDKSAKLWDSSILTTQDEHHTRVGHTGKITALSFSPDGTLAASSDEASLVKIWNTRTGVLINTMQGLSARVENLVFSPDCRLLAVTPWYSLKSFNLWDVASGVLLKAIDTAAIPSYVVFSSDSRWVFSSSSFEPLIEVWGTETGTLKNTLVGHSSDVPALEISVDGKLLASGSRDGSVKIWDASTGALQTTLAHDDGVEAVAISPDSTLVAVLTGHKIKIWDTATNSAVHDLEVDQIAWTLRFSKDGQYLCTNSASFDITPLYKGRFYPNLNIAVDGRWITRGLKRMIWLPPEYRPGDLLAGGLGFAVHGNMIILGSKTGGVCLLRFNNSVD
jgi:WD40 repeat protein